MIYIMSGPSGCGKSTWVLQHAGKGPCYSADNHFMVNGVYHFNPLHLGQAHAECLRDYANFLNHDYHEGEPGVQPTVSVDNTNISALEIAPYYQLASAYGFDVCIVRLPCKIEDILTRNVHGVPPAKVRSMYERWVKAPSSYPKWWKVIDGTEVK